MLSAKGLARSSSDISDQRWTGLASCSAAKTGPSTRNGSRKARGDASCDRHRARWANTWNLLVVIY